MAEFVLRRLLAAIPVLFLVSLIAASIMQLVPGDPASIIAGQSASDADIARVREVLGLDRPFPERLWDWYVGLAHGDLGQSLLLNRPVTQAIAERVPVMRSSNSLSSTGSGVNWLSCGDTTSRIAA